MRQRPRKFPLLSLILSLGLAGVALWIGALPATAQESSRVQFQVGASGTLINGTIAGSAYRDHVFSAQAGQTLAATLRVMATNGDGSAFFNIVPAGQDFPALYNGSTDIDRRARVTLPDSGDWAIRVYLMGNDRDAGRTVGYSINVSITSESGSQDTVTGPLPEEDFFIVRLSSDGVLNMRDAPRATAQKIGALRNGAVVRNAGGCTMSDGQQWCNVQASSGGLIGWVSARFLGLPGAGDQSGTFPGSGNTARVIGVAANDVLNVRSGPGTGNRIVGALANDDGVRMLGCREVGSSRWCEIEMMTDMRERGWVNARFLSVRTGQAIQLPSASRMQRVTFSSGSTGTELPDQLGPGTSVTYILNARGGQNLYFRLAASAANLSWRLFTPEGSLLDQGGPSKEYRGQLFRTGDHRIEVSNNGGNLQSFNVIFGIQ